MKKGNNPRFIADVREKLNGPWLRPVALAALVCVGFLAGQEAAAGQRPRDFEALQTAVMERVIVDESLELAGWEAVPDPVHELWQTLRLRRRQRLHEPRQLEPGITCRVDVLWHVLSRELGAREVEVELAQRSRSIRRRFALGGLGTDARWSQAAPGRLLRASYSVPVQPWPQEDPVELRLWLHYEDPVRPPGRVSLGRFKLSALRGGAQRAAILAYGGRQQEASAEFRRLFADERSIGELPRSLCGPRRILEPEDLARCLLLEGRVASAARLILRTSVGGPGQRGASLVPGLVELGDTASLVGGVGLAEPLYLLALRERPASAEAALGLERIRSGAADRAMEGVRRSAMWRLPADRWMGQHGAALYTNGTALIRFTAVPGPAELSIDVQGEPAGGQWPRLRARLNRRDAGELLADRPEGQQWKLQGELHGGENIIEIQYFNDFQVNGADRNARLGEVRIRYRSSDGGG